MGTVAGGGVGVTATFSDVGVTRDTAAACRAAAAGWAAGGVREAVATPTGVDVDGGDVVTGVSTVVVAVARDGAIVDLVEVDEGTSVVVVEVDVSVRGADEVVVVGGDVVVGAVSDGEVEDGSVVLLGAVVVSGGAVVVAAAEVSG